MALDWLPILPDGVPHRHHPRDAALVVAPFTAGFTPAPNILASLTFFPCLPMPTPRVRHARQEIALFQPFDVPTVVAPLDWAPIPGGPMPRPRRPRQEVAVIDPTFGAGAQIAASMAWAPDLPAPARQLKTHRPAVLAWDPTVIGFTGCLEFVDTRYTMTDLTGQALTKTQLISGAATGTDLLHEGLC